MTGSAKIEAPAIVAVSHSQLVRPTADGEGTLKISAGGQTVSVPVKITGQKEHYQPSFIRDVMPTLSRLGCNAGTCHGSAQGKNGFKLSLRGYDPIFDSPLTDRRPRRPALQPRRAGQEPDAAQDVRRRPARRRRADASRASRITSCSAPGSPTA